MERKALLADPASRLLETGPRDVVKFRLNASEFGDFETTLSSTPSPRAYLGLSSSTPPMRRYGARYRICASHQGAFPSARSVLPAVKLLLARIHRNPSDLTGGNPYFATWPVKPTLFNADTTPFGLKSPVTSKDSAPLVAVLAFTPSTLDSVSFTAVTHLVQQR